ncbi:Z-dependent protease inhibitor [Pelobates cultripes]|uniref:Z-dependent protease inhibitor n=2 Tax=Pelobates cultripes TaxID=61616 RepID=A0AAD1WV68_PELCU|nr:Z-dependent protease inhibitor [Pelobates cultripes]
MVTGPQLPLTPKVSLFLLYPSPITKPLCILINHILTAANMLFPLPWKKPVAPTLREWIQKTSAIEMLTMRLELSYFLLIGLCLAFKDLARKEKKDQSLQINCNGTALNASHFNNSGNELSVNDVTEMNSNFGFNLYRKMADKHDNNLFFSPFSVSYSLASLMLGTQGATYEQLLEGLNLNKFKNHKKPYILPALFKNAKEKSMNNEAFILDIGSFSFVHETFPLKEEFLNLTGKYFDIEYQTVDFHSSEAKNNINDYVNKKTKGKITQLYDVLDPQTKLLLLDYILFKGKWLYPFNPDLTEMDTFFIDKYNSVKVPMMYKSDKVYFMVDKKLSCTVVKVPYRGDAYMLIVMPEKDGDFVILEDHLNTELIHSWLAQMKPR